MSDVSAVTKYFATANEGFTGVLATTISSGAGTVPLTSVAGLTGGSIFVGIIEPGLTNQQVFTGEVDSGGSQIVNVHWTRGTNNPHTAGVTIVDYVTGTAFNMLTTGILKEHAQDGTHANITPDSIANAGNYVQAAGIFTIPDNSIDANELSTSAITLGHAPITGNVTGITSTTGALVTGLSATVTIPAGGRKVKITTWINNSSNTASANHLLQIWDGGVGSGTKLAEGNAKNRTAGDTTGFMQTIAVHTPSAGAKTYNIGFATNTGTATVNADATSPAFILVEAI